MNSKKISVKMIVSGICFVLGVIAIICGALMASPDFENKAFELYMTTTTENLAPEAFVAIGDMFSMIVAKYFVMILGVIVSVISLIGFAGSIDTMKINNKLDALQDSVYYDDIYESEECDGNCECCESDCSEEVAEAEEIEEVAEETTEE